MTLELKKHFLPHFNDRPFNVAIDTIVLHSMQAKDYENPFDIQSCIRVLDQCKVSAHYLISERGEIWQLVEEGNRAWHAGQSKMPFASDQRENVNDFSIGIELIGDEEKGFAESQYASLSLLTKEIMTRHHITSIVGHFEIAPERKTDPGENFSWKSYFERLNKAGVNTSEIKTSYAPPI